MSASQRQLRFALVVALTVVVIGWMGQTTWSTMHQIRVSFAAFEEGSFHLSDYIEGPVRGMNEALLEYGLHKNAASRTRFMKLGEALKQRLRANQRVLLAIPQEREILQQIEAALDVYLAQGLELMAQGPPPAGAKPLLERVEENASPLFELTDKLTAVERVALVHFVQDSHNSLAWLEGLLVLSLILLLGLAAVIGFSAYRELLLPLRSQLRQSRAVMERHEKLASLGTLAAGLAHEIRNPLTAINVRIHSLKRTLVKGSSEHEDATIIDGEIKRLEGIVQAFLQFARPAEPKLVTVSADSLLTRARALLGGQLEKAAIQLVLEPPPDVWLQVDPQQIEQVLINLVQNAAESIQRDGVIRLRARCATTGLRGHNGPAVSLEVSDTGKGIPPEVQKRLFDPFFTTKEEGTGLGLCIAARIVEQQGGTLQYTTQLNRGTTFTVLLPQAEHHLDEIPPKNLVN